VKDINGTDEKFKNTTLLIGGSPCQGFSIAGKGLNFDDPRSALFFEYVRLLKEIKPKYFFLENVRVKKEVQDKISELLGIEPLILNSSLVSAQRRIRSYWTNIPVETFPKDENIKLEDIIEYGYVDREKSYCLDASYYKGTSHQIYFERKRRQGVFEYRNYRVSSIRKLTPIECERLQTYPDHYTSGVSNTQRYKMLGNSFTVDMIAHFLKYIKYIEYMEI
jgi:site-specific DNA-cytosine methylase